MRRIVPLALVASFLALGSNAQAARESKKPNILIFLSDDVGWAEYGFQGAKDIPTPNIDSIAKAGVRFPQGYVSGPYCSPTRAGLMTGKYQTRFGHEFNSVAAPNGPGLSGDEKTFADRFKALGYATAAIGKWHLGFLSERPPATATTDSAGGAVKKKGKAADAGLPVGSRIIGGPITRGFDFFWGCSNARTMSALIEQDRVIENLPPAEMLPRLERQAVRYIADHAAAAKNGKPFFLYVPLTSPHTPILPTPEWQGRSGLNAYGDFTMQTDAVVGKILAALDAHGLAENTLVIFTADNGCSPAAGTPALERQGHYASAQFRGYKADIWEGGHRVPFLARWPGKIKPATTSAQTICHVDLLATCAEILGATLPPNAGEDSESMLPALLGTDRAPRREAVVHHSIHGLFAIRQGPWKLALCPGSGGWAAPNDAAARQAGLPEIQLYNLAADPAETKNVHAENPAVAARLRALLDRYVSEGRSTPGPKQPNDAAIDLLKSKATSAPP
jgi:arylsulfatase A